MSNDEFRILLAEMTPHLSSQCLMDYADETLALIDAELARMAATKAADSEAAADDNE